MLKLFHSRNALGREIRRYISDQNGPIQRSRVIAHFRRRYDEQVVEDEIERMVRRGELQQEHQLFRHGRGLDYVLGLQLAG